MTKATGKCRSCKADVIWTKTEAGRPMPVDAKPIMGGNIVVTLAFGGAESRYVRTSDADDTPRFTSHFVTCPHANKWRQGRAG